MKDVKSRYKVMGTWCARKLEKGARGRTERTKLGRVYTAIPPAEGWPGGEPVRNGWKPTGK